MDKALYVGHYDLICAEQPGVYTYWELKEDGTAIQEGGVVGTWDVTDDILIITYNNPAFGHTALTWDAPSVLVGENRHQDGTQYTWRFTKVIP